MVHLDTYRRNSYYLQLGHPDRCQAIVFAGGITWLQKHQIDFHDICDVLVLYINPGVTQTTGPSEKDDEVPTAAVIHVFKLAHPVA
jgi:hypothetical protein